MTRIKTANSVTLYQIARDKMLLKPNGKPYTTYKGVHIFIIKEKYLPVSVVDNVYYVETKHIDEHNKKILERIARKYQP